MNKLVIILLLIFSATVCSCGRGEKAAVVVEEAKIGKPKKTIIISEATKTSTIIATRKLGTLQHGEVIEFNIDIENGFNSPLIISKINSSCGCTSVEYDESPTKSNGIKQLKLRYNSLNRFGTQFANVTLVTNHGEFIVWLEVFIKN